MIKKTISEIAGLMQAPVYGTYKEDTTVEGVVIDSRQVRPGSLYVPILGQKVDGHSFIEQVAQNGAALAFWQKDHTPYPDQLPLILVEDTQQALAALAKAYLDTLHPLVIGVTGSNGKTSCKDMLYSVFSQEKKTQKTQGNRNNEIGLPLTVLDFDEDIEVAVLEMGMENKGEIAELCRIAAPDIAIITTIGSAHMENLGGKKQIAEAKCEIYDGLRPGGLFLYNKDCPEIDEVLREKSLDRSKTIRSFGKTGDGKIVSGIAYKAGGIEFSTSLLDEKIALRALGDHQAMNALPCIMAAKACEIQDESIQKGLAELKMTKMRTALTQLGAARVLDDSYKSNPESAQAAIDTLMAIDGKKHVAVLGDMLDLGRQENELHGQIGAYAREKGVDLLYAFGPLSKHTAQAFGSGGTWFETKEEIVDHLSSMLEDDVVILIKGSRAMSMDSIVTQLSGGFKNV